MSSIYTVSVVIAAMRGNRLEYSTNICGASATLENAKILAKSLADNDEDIVRIFISRNRLDQICYSFDKGVIFNELNTVVRHRDNQVIILHFLY